MKIELLPEKYWPIKDDRIKILKKYLNAIDIKPDSILSTEEIIRICIEKLKTFTLTEKEKVDLKDLILKQNLKTLEPSVKKIVEEIGKNYKKTIDLISLGCGKLSLFEKRVDEELHKLKPDIEINWLGLDIGDFREPNSFLKNQPFLVIDGDAFIKYASLIKTKKSEPVLLGRYSYHHLGTTFEEFNKRCTGISKVILFEEPITTEKWNYPDYRIMRIAYDIIANTVFSTDWASEFMKDPGKFKINYINTDDLSPENIKIEFKDTLPETALIIFSPNNKE